MGLVLLVTGYDRRSDRLVEEFELPLEAVEELRELFEGTYEAYPYFVNDYPVLKEEQVDAIQKYLGKALDLTQMPYFIGVYSS